jgi:hypothetical protein
MVILAATLPGQPIIDPQVRTDVGTGRARVLVQLRISEANGPRDTAIERAQDIVLARVPAVLVRRFHSVPLLALEIDAAGLRALEGLGEVVSRVEPDRPARAQ